MKTIEINIYELSELSDKAKENAYSNWLQYADYCWAGSNEATLVAFCNIFPIEVTKWSYDSYNGDFSMLMTCDSDISELSGVRLMKYIWNNYKTELFKGKCYSLWSKTEKRYKHSKILLDNCCVLTGYCIDDDILAPVYKFLNKPDKSTFEDLMNECLNNWLHACIKDCEYNYSYENFEKYCEVNNLAFDVNGNTMECW